jgi:hypothetical protein
MHQGTQMIKGSNGWFLKKCEDKIGRLAVSHAFRTKLPRLHSASGDNSQVTASEAGSLEAKTSDTVAVKRVKQASK